jgi:hypothetical protein
MSTLALNNENADVSIVSSTSSTLSQRVKALEEAGMHDRLIKKRIPSYALAAATIGNELQQLNINTNLYTGNNGSLTKIYQNPSNFGTIKLNSNNDKILNNNTNTDDNRLYRSSIGSEEREKIEINKKFKLNRIYKSDSNENVDLINNNNNSNKTSQRSSVISSTSTSNPTFINNERAAATSPITENDLVNKIKNLKKVSPVHIEQPVTSTINSQTVYDTINLNTKHMNDQPVALSTSSPISPLYSPNQNLTSFSKKTAQLIAQSLQRTNSNEENMHIPISIPLSSNKNNYFSNYHDTNVQDIENDVSENEEEEEEDDDDQSSISVESQILSSSENMQPNKRTTTHTIICVDSKHIDEQTSNDSKSMFINNALNNHLSTSAHDLLATTMPFKAPSYEQLNTNQELIFINNNHNKHLEPATTNSSNNNNNKKRNSSLYEDYINTNSNLNNNNTASTSNNNNNNNSRSQLVSIFYS